MADYRAGAEKDKVNEEHLVWKESEKCAEDDGPCQKDTEPGTLPGKMWVHLRVSTHNESKSIAY